MFFINVVLCLFCCCIVASSEDSEQSSDNESSTSNSKSHEAGTTDQPDHVLSDQELNQLGAKILRAEMMGDEVGFISLLHFNVLL